MNKPSSFVRQLVSNADKNGNGDHPREDPPLTLVPTPPKSIVAEPLRDYRRADLKEILPDKYWLLIAPFGEPNIDADCDIESLVAHSVMTMLHYAARHDRTLDHQKMKWHAEKEKMIAHLFERFAQAKYEIVAAIKPVNSGALQITQQRMETSEAAVARIKSYGYDPVKVLTDTGEIGGISKMANGAIVFVGLNDMGHRTTYTFRSFELAVAALEAWNGAGDPPGEWIDDKGRMSGDAGVHESTETIGDQA